jgi:hypothetical protein
MPRLSLGLLALGGLAAACAAADPPDRLPLRVLYVGNVKTDRGREFTDFFRKHFVAVEAAGREGFDPARAAGADVVVLDWSQNDRQDRQAAEERAPASPLGKREDWNKPTVLLNSAGLLLGEAWEVRGGMG